MAAYDATIKEHYASVASAEGLSETATMADRLIRQRETEAIASFVKLATGGQGRVADCGCGNGHTLAVLARTFPELQFTGFEYTPELRELAAGRFVEDRRIKILPGDIREAGFWGERPFDAVIVQRVIINLLDVKDQRRAVGNIVQAVRRGGHVIFIECFVEPFAELNEAREEFGLEPIGPAHHNLYLSKGFYDRDDLVPFAHPDWSFPPNYLSTHYFVSRAFEPGLTKGRPFKRNSQVQRFLSMAFPPAVGNFAPLMIHAFERK
jgi:SAM-dependent methyltransferase